MHTCGPTCRMIEMSSFGEVTSTETHRFVFLATMMEMSRFAIGFCVFRASSSYDVIGISYPSKDSMSRVTCSLHALPPVCAGLLYGMQPVRTAVLPYTDEIKIRKYVLHKIQCSDYLD